VIGVERRAALATRARRTLDASGVENVELLVGDGTRGVPERSPFEAIAVHATAPAPPQTLLAQLADGGRLVVPIATEGADLLTVFRRTENELTREEIAPCRFVPLIGEEGFSPPQP
jgi:protein-L-isoaspartate(D-aspartate) O-methyltransferase